MTIPFPPEEGWPPWSIAVSPQDLQRYVAPELIAKYVAIPYETGSPRVVRLSAVWDSLAGVGISYAHELALDDSGSQWIRSPVELLYVSRNGTCLDLAVLLAGACIYAGLSAAIVLLSPTNPSKAGHALVLILLGEEWPGGLPDQSIWLSSPPDFLESVQGRLNGPPRELLAIDPNGLARPICGMGGGNLQLTLDAAVEAGWRCLTGSELRWQLGVVAERRQDAYLPPSSPTLARRPPLEPRVPSAHGFQPPYSSLLTARYALIDLTSRGEQMQDLGDWMKGSAQAAVGVVHGSMGKGKTRLALELTDQANLLGWFGCFIDLSQDDAIDWSISQFRSGRPILIVIDYAESLRARVRKFLRVLKAELGHQPPMSRCRIRILFLARSLGSWWDDVKRWRGLLSLKDAKIIELASIPPNVSLRRSLYANASQLLAERLTHWGIQVGPLDQEIQVDWLSEDCETFLGIQMLALTHHLDMSLGRSALSFEDEAVEQSLLYHEERYWEQCLEAADLSRVDCERFRGAIATSVLVAPKTRAEALSLLSVTPGIRGLSGLEIEDIDRMLRGLYPPADTRQWGQLQPDRLGDFLLRQVTNRDPVPWRDFLEGVPRQYLEQAVIVIRRAAAQYDLPVEIGSIIKAIDEEVAPVDISPVREFQNAALARVAGSPRALSGVNSTLDEHAVESKKLTIQHQSVSRRSASAVHVRKSRDDLDPKPVLSWENELISHRTSECAHRRSAATDQQEER